MASDAERIKALRERTGKSSNEIASLAGLSDMEYFDLEAYDDELTTVLSLAQIKRVAAALGVPTLALFSDELPSVPRRIPYAELVALVDAHLAAGLSREAFEDEVGWDLAAFFESEERALSDYGVDFLQDVCSGLGIDCTAALP